MSWMKKSALMASLLGLSVNVAWAEPKSCQTKNLGAGEDKTICVYEKQTLAQAYAHVKKVIDGGVLLREAFPNSAVTDELPENNEEGLVNAAYGIKGSAWTLDLGYQGGQTTVLFQPKANDVVVEIVMSAD